MSDSDQEIEVRLTDGSLIRLAWMPDGALQVSRLVIVDLKDGHGFLPNAAAVIDPAKSRAFANIGAGSLKKLGQLAYFSTVKP